MASTARGHRTVDRTLVDETVADVRALLFCGDHVGVTDGPRKNTGIHTVCAGEIALSARHHNENALRMTRSWHFRRRRQTTSNRRGQKAAASRCCVAEVVVAMGPYKSHRHFQGDVVSSCFHGFQRPGFAVASGDALQVLVAVLPLP
jgi:hypothetical protein